MARSKNIKDYFMAQLSDLRPSRELAFDVHLYFAVNAHLILFMRAGDFPSAEILERYGTKGIKAIWIHNDDKAAFDAYKTGKIPAETEEGAYIASVLESKTFNPEQKRAIVVEAARAMLAEKGEAADPVELHDVDSRHHATVRDILNVTAAKAEATIAEIWKLSQISDDLDHSVNVATYAVIFAMAFGRIDEELLTDLALAGILHDIGITQVPSRIAPIAVRSMSEDQTRDYADHVGETIRLVEDSGVDIPERVKVLIAQHHEKFDGSGYPKSLSGFKVDDVAQLLAMADLLDTLVSGHWDGTKRNLKDAFLLIERMEKAKTFPEHFNPEVFAAVMRWVRSIASEELIGSAAEVVGSQAKEVIKAQG
jgi:HD-GYP domain-containing protein (c-di-GMP phosphodiesterase class II)